MKSSSCGMLCTVIVRIPRVRTQQATSLPSLHSTVVGMTTEFYGETDEYAATLGETLVNSRVAFRSMGKRMVYKQAPFHQLTGYLEYEKERLDVARGFLRGRLQRSGVQLETAPAEVIHNKGRADLVDELLSSLKMPTATTCIRLNTKITQAARRDLIS